MATPPWSITIMSSGVLVVILFNPTVPSPRQRVSVVRWDFRTLAASRASRFSFEDQGTACAGSAKAVHPFDQRHFLTILIIE
jgi:hypothetical protein